MTGIQGKPTAAAIYQANLDAVSEAVWAGDLPTVLRHVAIPHQMLTEDAEFVIASADEMLILMTDFRAGLIRMGADSYLRVCRNAGFLPGQDDVITGQHDTFVLNEGVALRPPYLNDMTLIRSADGLWRACRIEARARNDGLPIISPDMAAAQRRELRQLFQRSGRTPDEAEET
ncbi:hypothetical protein [Tabrizicola sp.]|uniref:hypothetical protein n=1 Tax=Tabrizicola sp. TaxID=2005166 RepID=UPI003F3F1D2B